MRLEPTPEGGNVGELAGLAEAELPEERVAYRAPHAVPDLNGPAARPHGQVADARLLVHAALLA
eukprot:10245772-Lingulodinium_polyedra.AAC.1